MDIFIFGFLFFKKEKNRSFAEGEQAGVPLVVCNQKPLFKDFLFDGWLMLSTTKPNRGLQFYTDVGLRDAQC